MIFFEFDQPKCLATFVTWGWKTPVDCYVFFLWFLTGGQHCHCWCSRWQSCSWSGIFDVFLYFSWEFDVTLALIGAWSKQLFMRNCYSSANCTQILFSDHKSPSVPQCTLLTIVQTHLPNICILNSVVSFLLFVTVGEAAWEHWCSLTEGAHSLTSRRRR